MDADNPVPVIPAIDALIEDAINAGGTLDMGAWHGGTDELWCGTTHCRAGWAIHLAGAQGRALQDRRGPYWAAQLIYAASRPGQRDVDFFTSHATAWADIQKCAAEQRIKFPWYQREDGATGANPDKNSA